METGSFIVYIKTKNIYVDITKDLETKFDASNDVLYGPLPKPKITKLFGLMEHELGEKIMTVFVVLERKS